jgi:ABC transporter fused permease/ATP-binding protein
MARRNKAYAEEDLPKQKLDKQGIRKLTGIFRFMLPYRVDFIAGLVSLLFSSTILLAFPYLTGKLIDASMGDGSWFLDSINQITLALVVVLAVQGIFSFLRIYFFSRVSERSMADIRKQLFGKYMTLPLSFFDQRRSGELLSRITADIALLQDTFSVTLAELVRQVSVLVIGLTILFVNTPKLTLFMLLTFPVLVIAGLVFGKYIRTLSKKTQDALAETNIIVEETLQAVSMVKAFTNEQLEKDRYGKAQEQVVQTALHAARYRGAFVSFIIFALFGGIVLVLWYGSQLVSQGALTIGDLTSFIIYTMFIGGSIGGLGDIYGSVQRAVGASDRVLDILEKASEWEPVAGEAVFHRYQGKIEYQQVAFAYPSRKSQEVLKKISFSVAPGEKVALVGPSGAGKSTIIQLLLRFYEPLSGAIYVDGQPASQLDLSVYRGNIGVVPQEVILFGGTIRENIAYGKPGATFEEIREAARKANALDFIEGFPEQFETLVGERGVKLSGGQKQRVAIARAILKDPAILVLDEATSSLDAESELLVQQALNELMKGRTTVIIAHRLSTIRAVDQIFVIDQGELVESGTHEELLQLTNGIYSNLIRLQFDLA